MKRQAEIEKRLQAQATTYGVIGSGEDGFAISINISAIECFEIVASWGRGWDHVSVKIGLPDDNTRIPTWEEMCSVKELFWRPSEWVVQYHPGIEEYKNCHPHVLHLWKPRHGEIKRPPLSMV